MSFKDLSAFPCALKVRKSAELSPCNEQRNNVKLAFFVVQYFIVKEISLNISGLEFVDFRVDELSEVLEVEKLLQEILHVRT